MFYQSVTAALVLFCSNVIAKDTIVYRWVDNNKVVHYSHEHPADKDYSEVNIQVAYSAPIIEPVSSTENDEDNTNNNQQPASQLSPEEITKNCESAQVNLKVLNSFERITVEDENGEARLLSDEEKQEQIELSNKHIDVYCASAQRLSKNTY